MTTTERFWSYVDKRGTCWTWQGPRDKDGYGKFSIGRRSVRAHRYSLEIATGPVPTDKVVRHSCDNPPCVNPEHLSVGTPRDNIEDSFARGRRERKRPPVLRGIARGERHWTAKVTAEDVRRIRARAAAGVSQAALAGEHRLSQSAVSLMVARKTWAHVEG